MFGDARATFVILGKVICSSVDLARPAVPSMWCFKTTSWALAIVLVLRAINSTEGEVQKDREELLSRIIQILFLILVY